jgi:hypothetical protein
MVLQSQGDKRPHKEINESAGYSMEFSFHENKKKKGLLSLGLSLTSVMGQPRPWNQDLPGGSHFLPQKPVSFPGF